MAPARIVILDACPLVLPDNNDLSSCQDQDLSQHRNAKPLQMYTLDSLGS